MAQDLIGIIGGSGLGDELEKHITGGKFQDIDTPFGKPSGPILLGKIGKRQIAFINRHGKGHFLSPCKVPYAANIFAFKKLGVHTIISSGAVGSLQEKNSPGHLVIVDQFIDKTFKRQNTFFADYGAVHCELAHPLCDRLRKQLSLAAKNIKVKTHTAGTYVCMEGPQFSTRAESLMHRKWGADLIGMTAMPEAKLAREAQVCYCLIALASDYDCWRPHEAKKDKQTLLNEILSNLTMATNNCIELIKAALNSDIPLCSEDCQCRKSLELAVWTAPNAIDSVLREKIKVLFE